jgi:hypothetical protein
MSIFRTLLGIEQKSKIDPALEKLLKEKGIIDIQGKAIVSPEAVKAKAQQVSQGYDPITNLKKDTTVLPPLATKQALSTNLPATEKFTTSPIKSEQKLSPFAAGYAATQNQLSKGEPDYAIKSISGIKQYAADKDIAGKTSDVLRSIPSGSAKTIGGLLPSIMPEFGKDEQGKLKVSLPSQKETTIKANLKEASYSILSGLLSGAETTSRLAYENKEKITKALGYFKPEYQILGKFLDTPTAKNMLPEDFSKITPVVDGMVKGINDKAREQLSKQKGSWQQGDINKIIEDGEFIPFLFSETLPYIGLVTGGALAGGTPLALGLGSTAVGGMAKEEAKEFGADTATADKVAILNGLVNMVTEAAPFSIIFKNNPAVKRSFYLIARDMILEPVVAEGGQEMIQEAIGNAIAKWYYDNERKITDGLAMAGVFGGATGIGMKGLFRGLSKAPDKMKAGLSIEEVKDDSIPQEIDTTENKIFKSPEVTKLQTKIDNLNQSIEEAKEKGIDYSKLEEKQQEVTTQLREIVEVKKLAETTNEAFIQEPMVAAEEINQLPFEQETSITKKMIDSTDINNEAKINIQDHLSTPYEPELVKQRTITIQQKNNIVNLVKETQKRITDLSLLKQRMLDRFKMTQEVKKKDKIIKDIKTKIGDDEAVRNLLVKYLKSKIGAEAEQGEFISLIKNIASTKDETKLTEAMERIDAKADKIAAEQMYRKEVSRLKSTIAFVKKLGDFNQTVIQDIKEDLNARLGDSGLQIDKLSDANPEQLQKFLDVMKERLKYKLDHGFEIEGEKRFPTEPTAEMTEEFVNMEDRKTIDIFKDKKGFLSQSASKTANEFAVPVNSRLYNIDPELRHRVIEMEQRKGLLKNEWSGEAIDFVKFLNELEKNNNKEYKRLWYALSHGQKDIADSIAKQYNKEEALKKVRNVLDNIYDVNTKAGAKFDYRKNLFPRVVKDKEGLLIYIFGKDKVKSKVDKLVQDLEIKFGRKLEANEKDYYVNKFLVNFPLRNIGLNQAGNTKSRMIDVLTPEMMQFYHKPQTALESYITNLAEDTAKREMFGQIEGDDFENSIGKYVNKLVEEGKITNTQIDEVAEMLKARFTSRGTDYFGSLFREVTMLTTLGSVINSLTQLKDFARSADLYGIFLTAKNVTNSALNKSEIDLFMMGLESEMSEILDLYDGSKSGMLKKYLNVRKLFRINLLTWIDAVGKEAIANSAVDSLREMAKSQDPAEMEKLTKELRKHITEDKILETIEDLKNGLITENIKLVAFSAIAKQQPIALSEYPQKYLEMRNGKLFYTLKAFSIKQFDYVRQDLQQEWQEGNKVGAMLGLAKTMIYLSLWGATIDELKDFIKGKDVEFSDNVIDNFLQVIFMSKYNAYKIKQDGLGKWAAGIIMPPMKLVDSFVMTALAGSKWADKAKKTLVRNIPYVGEMYYWWFVYDDKKKSPSLPKGSSSGGGMKRPSSGSSGLKRPSSGGGGLKRP